MRYQITAPTPGFSGESCGVQFRQGAAETDDGTKERRAALEYFRRRGYTVAAIVEAEPEEPEPSGRAPEKPAEFDPAAHGADEVVAYLDSLGTDDSDAVAEFDRVIAAERGGKARKTILTRAREASPQQGEQK